MRRSRRVFGALLFAAPFFVAASPAYDPLATARANLRTLIGNVEAGIPAQCYTKTGADSNPCYVCHTVGRGDNRQDDSRLQSRYDFSELGRSNHWTNLFVDHRPGMAAISDDWIRTYLAQDNYTPLKNALADPVADFEGYRPDLDWSAGFDADGFARDGSGWRAFRYKPFPGTFWPTNGSADTVLIRLPKMFQQDAKGAFSKAVYVRNLALLEKIIATADGRRFKLPAHYEGGAASIATRRWRYPEGTEFLHTVHYVDPADPTRRSVRLKELRYGVKDFDPTEQTLAVRYADEEREQKIGGRPHYSGTALQGQTNGWGWRYLGYIEDSEGRLRLQTREEQLYCMGCHTGLGVTVDSSFSLARKVPGDSGWGLQSTKGIRDLPQAGSTVPEYARYLSRVRAGDEFRANTEMLTRFFAHGRLDDAAVRKASTPDITALITPSRDRAFALAKAYVQIVREQSYVKGRAAMPEPALNVHNHLDNDDTALKASGRTYKDGRLWLDWTGR